MKLRKIKFSLCIMLIVALLISSNANLAQAAASYKRLVGVGSKKVTLENGTQVSCHNLGTMCVVGSTVYCIKTDNGNNASTLYAIAKYTTTPATTSKVITNSSNKIVSLGHANGMTYYEGSFYIATARQPGKGSQIVKVSKSGIIEAEYVADYEVSSISYCRAGYFIVNAPSNKPGYLCYAVGKISGNKFTSNRFFYVKDAVNCFGQDTHYEDGTFYIVRTVNEAQLKKNKILMVDLSDTILNNKMYSSKTLNINDTSSAIKFEIESLDIVSGTKMRFCINGITSDNTSNDAIYTIDL